MDCLKLAGNSPVDKDRLTILVIVGAKTKSHFFQQSSWHWVQITPLVKKMGNDLSQQLLLVEKSSRYAPKYK